MLFTGSSYKCLPEGGNNLIRLHPWEACTAMGVCYIKDAAAVTECMCIYPVMI